MQTKKLFQALADNPVIAAVKDESDLEEALATDVTIIFVLHSTIFNIYDMSKKSTRPEKSASFILISSKDSLMKT